MKIYFDDIYQFEYIIDLKTVDAIIWHPAILDDARIKSYISNNLKNGKLTFYDIDQENETFKFKIE